MQHALLALTTAIFLLHVSLFCICFSQIYHTNDNILCHRFYAVFPTHWRHLVNDCHSTRTCCVLVTKTTNFSEIKRVPEHLYIKCYIQTRYQCINLSLKNIRKSNCAVGAVLSQSVPFN